MRRFLCFLVVLSYFESGALAMSHHEKTEEGSDLSLPLVHVFLLEDLKNPAPGQVRKYSQLSLATAQSILANLSMIYIAFPYAVDTPWGNSACSPNHWFLNARCGTAEVEQISTVFFATSYYFPWTNLGFLNGNFFSRYLFSLSEYQCFWQGQGGEANHYYNGSLSIISDYSPEAPYFSEEQIPRGQWVIEQFCCRGGPEAYYGLAGFLMAVLTAPKILEFYDLLNNLSWNKDKAYASILAPRHYGLEITSGALSVLFTVKAFAIFQEALGTKNYSGITNDTLDCAQEFSAISGLFLGCFLIDALKGNWDTFGHKLHLLKDTLWPNHSPQHNKMHHIQQRLQKSYRAISTMPPKALLGFLKGLPSLETQGEGESLGFTLDAESQGHPWLKAVFDVGEKTSLSHPPRGYTSSKWVGRIYHGLIMVAPALLVGYKAGLNVAEFLHADELALANRWLGNIVLRNQTFTSLNQFAEAAEEPWQEYTNPEYTFSGWPMAYGVFAMTYGTLGAAYYGGEVCSELYCRFRGLDPNTWRGELEAYPQSMPGLRALVSTSSYILSVTMALAYSAIAVEMVYDIAHPSLKDHMDLDSGALDLKPYRLAMVAGATGYAVIKSLNPSFQRFISWVGHRWKVDPLGRARDKVLAQICKVAQALERLKEEALDEVIETYMPNEHTDLGHAAHGEGLAEPLLQEEPGVEDFMVLEAEADTDAETFYDAADGLPPRPKGVWPKFRAWFLGRPLIPSMQEGFLTL